MANEINDKAREYYLDLMRSGEVDTNESVGIVTLADEDIHIFTRLDLLPIMGEGTLDAWIGMEEGTWEEVWDEKSKIFLWRKK